MAGPRDVHRTPFALLWRMFVAQFVTSDSATTEVHLRERVVWVLAFLLVPGVFIVILLYPEITAAVVRARLGLGPASYVDDVLMWMALVLTTYSMAGTGFITALAWDALAFDRRDAAVLGPLPLRPLTIMAAKLAALGTLLAAGSLPINFLNAAAFASATGDQLGWTVLVEHFADILVATVAASVFIFAAIVTIRATVGWIGGPRLMAALGPPLQFVCVVALLSLVMLSPAVLNIRFMTNTRANWMPPAWFMGMFEYLRGSPRIFNHVLPVLTLARRACVGTAIAVACAWIASVLEVRRHLAGASIPSASVGFGAARMSRGVARVLVGRDMVARATADFILLTLARTREPRVPIAINAAIGATLVVAALSTHTRNLASLTHPRTAVLWIPLVLSYWIAVGVRASFFVPSEAPAAWVFRLHARNDPSASWLAVRASMMALVVPPTVLIAAVVMVPLLGWGAGAWHVLFALAMAVLVVQVLTLTLRHIPFTRPSQPGHAQLKTRWWIYVVGLFTFAYGPARWELGTLGDPIALFEAIALMAAAIALLEVVGRRTVRNWSVESEDEASNDLSSLTVLGLGGLMQSPGIRLELIRASARDTMTRPST
jgi:hypothetical protein